MPRTYVKLAIIIVAPKKHKTHGLSELDDVGIENGNDHPGIGGARGDRPARRAVRRADWTARGVLLRHESASANRRPWRPELCDPPLFRNAKRPRSNSASFNSKLLTANERSSARDSVQLNYNSTKGNIFFLVDFLSTALWHTSF